MNQDIKLLEYRKAIRNLREMQKSFGSFGCFDREFREKSIR
jgi:hypothetical protein